MQCFFQGEAERLCELLNKGVEWGAWVNQEPLLLTSRLRATPMTTARWHQRHQRQRQQQLQKQLEETQQEQKELQEQLRLFTAPLVPYNPTILQEQGDMSSPVTGQTPNQPQQQEEHVPITSFAAPPLACRQTHLATPMVASPPLAATSPPLEYSLQGKRHQQSQSAFPSDVNANASASTSPNKKQRREQEQPKQKKQQQLQEQQPPKQQQQQQQHQRPRSLDLPKDFAQSMGSSSEELPAAEPDLLAILPLVGREQQHGQQQQQQQQRQEQGQQQEQQQGQQEQQEQLPL